MTKEEKELTIQRVSDALDMLNPDATHCKFKIAVVDGDVFVGMSVAQKIVDGKFIDLPLLK